MADVHEDLFTLADQHAPTEHRGSGIVQLLLGDRHAVVAAVCARSIRRHWDGPVTLYHDAQAVPYARQIADAGQFALVDVSWLTDAVRQRWRRNTGYVVKTFIPRLSPYECTLQMDVDMLVVKDVGDIRVSVPCVPAFGDWVTTGRVMRKRIEKWIGTHPLCVRKCFNSGPLGDKPAVNTGVVLYGAGHKQITTLWPGWTLTHAGEFIADEIAMQLLIEASPINVIDDQYNRSHRHGKSDDTVIWHFHGKKHCKPPGVEIWWPEYAAAVEENYAGLADWTPAGDKRLAEHLLQGV